MQLPRLPRYEIGADRRQSRLVTALREQSVARIQVIYATFDGTPLASLVAYPTVIDAARIELAPRICKALKRLFHRRMLLTFPRWLDQGDVVGIVTWDLQGGAFTHEHSGYNPNFYSRTERVVSAFADRGAIDGNSRIRRKCQITHSSFKYRS